MVTQKTNVIEWQNPGFEDIIWSYPYEDVRWASSLIVKEWESAIFMRDGKLFDVFGSGRHILSTQNLPLLTRSYNFLLGYKETPFKVNIIFLSTKVFNSKWGVRTMVKATEDMPAPIPLMANGDYQFRVEDPILFVTQIAGGNQNVNSAKVNQFLKGFLNEKLIQELSKYPYMEVFSNLEKTSTKVQVNIYESLRQRGVELITLKLVGIDTEEPYKTDLYNYQRFISSGGKEYRQFETMDKMAEAIGKSNGAGVGAGMLLFPQMYQNLMPQQHNPALGMQSQTPPTQINKTEPIQAGSDNFNICPYCGKELRLAKPPRFCPFCKENIELL